MATVNQMLLVDLGQTNPRAFGPKQMSNELTRELIDTIDLGDFELTQWELEFIEDMLTHTTFSYPQREVIYNLAHKFKLL